MSISPHTYVLGGGLYERFGKQYTTRTSSFQADEQYDGLVLHEED